MLMLVIQQLIYGLEEGVRYSLIAIGFTIFFGVLNVIVFCVGDIATVGVFLILALHLAAGALNLYGILPGFLVALSVIFLGSALTGLFGILVDRVGVRPFRKSNPVIPLIATVSLGIIIRESISLFYPRGRDPQFFPEFLSSRSVNIGEISLTYRDILIIVIALALMSALFFLVNRTKFGRSIRAIAQNREAAVMMGINVSRVHAYTFLLVGFVMGISGFLMGSYLGSVRYDMGLREGIIGFSAAVVGGLGNIYGAIIGGLVFGVIEALTMAFVPMGGAYKEIFCFVAVIFFMVFRPSGIIGEKISREKV
jgi:branched-chain amino acid transport system permease protein